MKIIYYSIDKQQEWRLTKMKNLLAAGFMFVGGAILMLAEEYANWVPIAGSIIAPHRFGNVDLLFVQQRWNLQWKLNSSS